MAIGGSKNKSKTKESSQQQESFSRTTTPTAPGFITSPIQGVAERVGAIGQSGQPIVTGASPLQSQAFGQAGSLGAPSMSLGGQQVNPFRAAGNIGLGAAFADAPRMEAASLSDPREVQARLFSALGEGGLNPYLNPYQSQVTNAFAADFDANAGRLRAQQEAQQAMNGGLLNSNNAVLSALTEGELSRARGSGLASILQGGFDRATGLAMQDLDRGTQSDQFNASQVNQAALARAQLEQQARMANQGSEQQRLQNQFQAAGLLGNLGQAQGAEQRANIGLTAGLGEQQRDIANEQAQADLQREAQIAQIIAMLTGTGAVVGQTDSGTSQGTGSRTGSSTGYQFGASWSPAKGWNA